MSQEYEERLAKLEQDLAESKNKPDYVVSPKYGVPVDEQTLNKYKSGHILQTPEIVRSAGAVSRDQLGSLLNKLNAETVANTQASIQRAISTSTGFTPYVLETPSIRIYPTEAPFTQLIPRVVGRGTDIEHWKSVLSIFFYNSINSGPFGQTNWGSTTDGGTTLNTFAYNVQSYQTTYQTIFQPQTQTFQSQWRSRALEGDLMARAKMDTLYALKLQEENWLLNAATQLFTPPPPVLVGNATGGNLAAGTFYVCYTATNGAGESTPSSIVPVVVGGSGSGSVTMTFFTQPQATGYKFYMGTASNALHVMVAADFSPSGIPVQPVDYIGTGIVTATIVTAPTTGAAQPSSNTATISGQFDGALSLCYKNPNGLTAPSVGEQGMTSVIVQPAASTGLLALQDFNHLFRVMYSQARANPSHLFVSPIESETLATLLGTSSNYRFVTEPTEPNLSNLVVGTNVSKVLNPVTNTYVQVVTVPYLPQGTIIAGSFSVPFPLPSGVSDPPFRVMVNQDYTYAEYPPTIANPQQWGWAYLVDECLVNQWQGGWGLINGIVPPTGY